jgi:hypothetical protein
VLVLVYSKKGNIHIYMDVAAVNIEKTMNFGEIRIIAPVFDSIFIELNFNVCS